METTTNLDAHGVRLTTTVYDSGTIAEWYGPFEAELTDHLYLRDSFGRRQNGGPIHQPAAPRVFVTRYRTTGDNEREEFNVLGAGGLVTRIDPDEAREKLSTKRVDGQLVPAHDDPTFQAANERWQQLLAD
jgi:hypothetical protein